jgi:hypothetical protein
MGSVFWCATYPPTAKAGATLVAITTIIKTTYRNTTTMRFIRVSPPLYRTTRPSVKGYNGWRNFRDLRTGKVEE